MNNEETLKNSTVGDPSRRRLLAQLALGATALFSLTEKRAFASTESKQPSSAGSVRDDPAVASGGRRKNSQLHRPYGIFTHVVPGDHATKARLVKAAGFTCVQWYPALDGDELTEANFRKVASIYAAEDITIAAVSGYANLFDPRPDFRRAERERLSRILLLAPACGCPLVCTETGTLNPKRGSHPDNTRPEIWNEFVDLTGQYLSEAARAGSTLVLEAYTKNVCRDTHDIRRLLAAVGRPPQLRFVVDPFNIVYEPELSDVRRVLEDYFSVIGSLCSVAHAKDLIFETGEKATPRAGAGIFDWPVYASLLNEQLPETPLILEHLKWPEVQATFSFVKQQLQPAGKRG